MKRALVAMAVATGLALTGCGESEEEKAKNEVCDARADIQKQVNELQDLTLGTATGDKIRSNLKAIEDDIAKISDARGQLDSTRKRQAQEANETFKTELESLREDLGSSESLSGAAQRLKAGIASLADVYKQAYAPIDCG